MAYDSSLNLAIQISAVDKASSVLSSLIDKVSGGNGLVKALTGVGIAAAGVAIGLGTSFVQTAAQFQESSDLLVAHAGLAKGQLDSVQQSLLQMGPELGQLPDALAQAIYPVLSGFSGISNASDKAKLSLTELKDAGMSVAGTTTNITDVTSAATATFNAFGMQTTNNNTNIKEMNTLFDQMNTVITLGNQQWSDFSNVAGKLAVSAKAAHIQLTEAYAAEATLTNEGYSARLATTYLGNAFNTLEIKTDSMAKHAKTLGVNFNEAMFRTMDLGSQLEYLNRITGGDQSKLLGIFGGNSIALKTFDALNTSLGNYKSNLQSLTNAQGTTNASFGDTKDGFSFKLKQAQASLSALSTAVGNALLPTLTGLMNNLTPMIGQFGTWLEKSGALKDITGAVAVGIQDLGNVIGGTANVLGTLVGWVGNFFSGLQQGDPWVDLLVGGVTALGTAIGLIKIEEWAAGWANTFAEMKKANGIIAGLASDALPNLGKWLGWTKVAVEQTNQKIADIAPTTSAAVASAQADIDSLIASFDEASTAAAGTGTAITSVGTEAVASEGVVAGAATGMTVAMGLATAGISLLVGALAAGISHAVADANNAVYNMSVDTKKAFDSLGTSAADTSAKIAASAQEASHNYTGFWQKSAIESAQASNDMKAKMILDQQAVADAAEKQAGRMDAAWTKASQDANLVALLHSQGWGDYAIKQYLAGSGVNTVSNSPATIGRHASGGMIAPGDIGYVHANELLVPGGMSGLGVIPAAQSASMLSGGHTLNFSAGAIIINAPGGDPGQISSRFIDAIERELARRFRMQTSGYAGRGSL